MSDTQEQRDHLIRKGRYFYRPNRAGYTSDPIAAGRYTKAEAEREAAIEPWHMEAVPVSTLPPQSRPSRRWRHIKRGTVYDEIGRAELQIATFDVVEGSFLVIYRGDDGKLWARQEDEFEDGRFEEVP